MLTISKLKRWSINYYIDTAQTAEQAAKDLARAGGGLGEYHSQRETRTPLWLSVGDSHTVATLVGLTDPQRAGGDAVRSWWRAGSTTVSLRMVRMGAHSVSAVCTASI
jgi:hypothetical protein